MARARILLAFVLTLLLAAAQVPGPAPFPTPPMPGDEPEKRLPDGRSLNDVRAKAAYESSLDDARKLVKDAEDLKTEIEKNDRYVVSVSAIKKTEEIEKLAKRIRGRMKQL
jgi:hypothetical protein